ncbi:MAG: hypothetical protein V4574_20990 [Pseudomonadota bacterium]
MTEFRIKWAAAGAVYAGMLFGIIQLVVNSGKVGLPELMLGAFMGGAIALPLTACHLAAALAVLLFARRQPFATQFALFTVLALGGWLLVVALIDQAFRSIGGIHGATLAYLAFFAAGTGACLVCMIAAGRTAQP